MSKHKNKQIEVPWAVITDGIIKAEVGTTVRIPLKLIVPNPDQPRKFFDPSELEALALSCKERGDVEKPIDVVLRDNGRNVLIVDGENRYRSVQLGKLKGVSCYIRPPMNDNDVYLSSAIANIRRKDFSIIEIALALHELQQRFKLNQTEAGERLGMKPHQTLYYLRFLNLIEEVQILLMHGKLGAGVALQLAKFSQEHQKLLLQKIKEAVRANGSKPIHPNKIARILRRKAQHRCPARIARTRTRKPRAIGPTQRCHYRQKIRGSARGIESYFSNGAGENYYSASHRRAAGFTQPSKKSYRGFESTRFACLSNALPNPYIKPPLWAAFTIDLLF